MMKSLILIVLVCLVSVSTAEARYLTCETYENISTPLALLWSGLGIMCLGYGIFMALWETGEAVSKEMED